MQASTSDDHADARSKSEGRERRRHHRRATRTLWAEIDNERCVVRDLSLGGLSIQPPDAYRRVDQLIHGELCQSSGGTKVRMSLQAKVVRIDNGAGFVGAAFMPMEAEQIDALLNMLSAIERDYLASRDAEERRLAFYQTLRRVGIIGGVTLAGLVGGYVLWTMG